MTQVFAQKGTVVPVTVVDISGNIYIGKKKEQRKVVIGFGKKNKPSRSELGKFKKTYDLNFVPKYVFESKDDDFFDKDIKHEVNDKKKDDKTEIEKDYAKKTNQDDNKNKEVEKEKQDQKNLNKKEKSIDNKSDIKGKEEKEEKDEKNQKNNNQSNFDIKDITGKRVDVTGISKGKGFQGVVKRWGFKGGPQTHGQSDRLRAPGSIGAGTTPGRVWKGKKMPGRMGGVKHTIKNLKVVKHLKEDNLLLIKGSVPGSRNSKLIIKIY